MKKIVIASHNNLAKGLKETINYIAPNTSNILDVNAYVGEESLEELVDNVLSKFDVNEQIIVLTDMAGGSVNQEFAKRLSNHNIELVAGVNLPVALSLILNIGDQDLTSDLIRQTVLEAREQLIYVNDSLLNQSLDDEDE